MGVELDVGGRGDHEPKVTRICGGRQGSPGGDSTLRSEGGTDLFNLSAIAYVDGDGGARVMVLGGDDVEDPGTPRAGVLYY